MNWEIISPLCDLAFNMLILCWIVSVSVRCRRLEAERDYYRECYE
jgi:hypothetical protein